MSRASRKIVRDDLLATAKNTRESTARTMARVDRTIKKIDERIADAEFLGEVTPIEVPAVPVPVKKT